MKIISLISAGGDEDILEFRCWYLKKHAPRLLQSCPGLKRLVVNLVDFEPDFGVELAQMAHRRTHNAYEVTTEIWFDSVEDYTDLGRRYASPAVAAEIESELAERTRRICTYQVDEAYQILRSHSPAPLGQRLPGIKQISLLLWRMHESRARDFWREHAARALPYHIGLSKYVQNWVVQPLSPNAQPLHAIGELYWPTLEDFRDRRVVPREGHVIISRDVREQQDPSSLYTGEYRLKGGEAATGLQVDYLNYVTV